MARDTSFYYSFLVLPPEKRHAIIAVWDFCRAVDDAVDEIDEGEDGGAAASELARWRREVDACFPESVRLKTGTTSVDTASANVTGADAASGRPETRQGRALAPLVKVFGFSRKPFDDLIDGVEMDLGARRYETFDDLYEYCIRVASAVGLICLDIFGARVPRSRQYAIELGVALQLTNILRDVGGDFARGRVYLPLEDLRAFGCTEDDLRQEVARAGSGVRSPAVKALLRHQAVRAREYYARAARALPREDARRLVAAEIMAAIYRGVLGAIERRDYDVFSEVVRIPRPRRAVIAAATWARTLIAPGGTRAAISDS